jgi:GTP cyclohydrolase II
MEQVDLNTVAKKNKMSVARLQKMIDMIKWGMEPLSKRIPVTENKSKQYYAVERRGVGILNTKYGKFWEFEFKIDDCWEKYTVIVKANINLNTLMPVFKRKKNLILRIDSGCKTGQLLGDLTCECRDQLDLALKTLAQRGEGVIVNIPKQDGRGMGIAFKLATLWLQDALGVNTVESATILSPGGVIDIRTYSGVVGIMKFFGLPKTCIINLASNNPHKVSVFRENGYIVGNMIPVVIPPTKYTRKHLRAKQECLGHIKLV